MQVRTFEFTTTIRKDEVDVFGHVNNAAYLTLFEKARWQLLKDNGYGLDYMQKTGAGPVILEVTIKYLKELNEGDSIIILSKMQSYHNKIGVLLQEMYRNDLLCCEAHFKMGLFDLTKRKLIDPTPDWLKVIGIYKT